MINRALGVCTCLDVCLSLQSPFVVEESRQTYRPSQTTTPPEPTTTTPRPIRGILSTFNFPGLPSLRKTSKFIFVRPLGDAPTRSPVVS